MIQLRLLARRWAAGESYNVNAVYGGVEFRVGYLVRSGLGWCGHNPEHGVEPVYNADRAKAATLLARANLHNEELSWMLRTKLHADELVIAGDQEED